MGRDKVTSDNLKKPHSGGMAGLTNFCPYPTNPVIARFFKEIGRADELGSGVRNTFKYCGEYTATTNPVFMEGEVFKIIIPAKPTGQLSTQTTREKILQLLRTAPSLSGKDIANRIGSISEDSIRYHLQLLKMANKIKQMGGTRGYWQILYDI